MFQKTYLTILKIGVYLSFLSVLLVFKNLLFPFITSKQIYFNILIEILFVFWLVFIIQYPSWRPKKSWISIGLICFFTAITISCFTGVDFNLSFWGDIERMLGVFHLLHFLVFYFIIITVFKEWKDWKILFIISIICSVFVSFYGLANMHYSTIGNTAYVSGYLIFNIYFALLLFFKEKNSGGWRWLYIASIPIMLLEFKKAGTTGAYVGLGFSIVVLLFLYAILNKNKKIRIYTLIFGVLLISVLGLSFANKDSDFISKIPVLKVVRQVDFQKNTFQTRLISWRAAAEDFKNQPILGTGHGNFAIIFDKHFEPTFYDYTRSETYFDRAHNNIIDIASTTGIAGLLTYLSIFIAVGYYLIKSYRDEKIDINDFILLTCLIIAYFVQNLAVFDSLVTYISLMITLGFIYYISQEQEQEAEYVKNRPFNNKEIFVLFGTGLLISVILFQYNIKPLKMLKGTIDGQIAFAQGDIISGVEIYKKALSYNTVLDRDSRDSLVRAITAKWTALNGIDRKKAQEILDYAIEICKKNIQYNPQDSLTQTELAQILNITAQFNKNNSEKFYFYSDQALEAINNAINASPKRIPIYYSKAQIYAIRGENDKAIETLEYAAGLNEKYYDSFCNLARYNFIAKNKDRGFEAMDKCLDLGGAGLLSPEDYVNSLINYYAAKEDWPRVLKLYERMSKLKPKDPKTWINLATLYAKAGDNGKAIEAANKVTEIDPTLKDDVEVFIRELEQNQK